MRLETTLIRNVIPKEATLLSEIAFSAKAHWDYPSSWMEQWRDELIFPPEFFEANESWVVEVDDAPVAFCTLQEKEDHAWFENLWVSPEHMRKGIGSQLFAHVVEVSRSRGYSRLRLESDPHAAGFYEKLGMHKIGERRADMEDRPRVLPIMEISI